MVNRRLLGSVRCVSIAWSFFVQSLFASRVQVSDVCDRIGKERNWTAGTGKLVKGVKFLAGDKTLEEVGVDGSTSGLVATGVKEQPLPERLPKPEDDPFSLQPGGFGFHGAWGPQAGFGMHGKDMGFGDFGHHPRRQADWSKFGAGSTRPQPSRKSPAFAASAGAGAAAAAANPGRGPATAAPRSGLRPAASVPSASPASPPSRASSGGAGSSASGNAAGGAAADSKAAEVSSATGRSLETCAQALSLADGNVAAAVQLISGGALDDTPAANTTVPEPAPAEDSAPAAPIAASGYARAEGTAPAAPTTVPERARAEGTAPAATTTVSGYAPAKGTAPAATTSISAADMSGVPAAAAQATGRSSAVGAAGGAALPLPIATLSAEGGQAAARAQPAPVPAGAPSFSSGMSEPSPVATRAPVGESALAPSGAPAAASKTPLPSFGLGDLPLSQETAQEGLRRFLDPRFVAGLLEAVGEDEAARHCARIGLRSPAWRGLLGRLVQSSTELGPGDSAKVDELALMSGKPKAECKAAFLACGKNMDEAAIRLLGS